MPNARDGYREYLAEKLWQWLPAIYRELDAPQGSLRALIETLAAQAAVLKRNQDRLWDDAYVELADDWAIPYLAELVGTRLVSALDPRARRVDVAKTLYYRRRKGTLAVLEQLIADMAGWDGKVIEEFRLLARTRHGLDGIPTRGPLTGTPEGGLADLRQARGALLTGDLFEEFHYTPDTRRPSGVHGQRGPVAVRGQRGIAKLSFHLYRLQSVGLTGVQPRRMKNLAGQWNGWSFDPSGRDIPLFAAGSAEQDWHRWHSADEWALPRALTCRLLGESWFEIGDVAVAWAQTTPLIGTQAQRMAAAADLRLLLGQRFAQRDDLRRVLTGLASGAVLTQAGVFAQLLVQTRSSNCGSATLLPDAASGQASHGVAAVRVSDSAGVIDREQTRSAKLDDYALPTVSDVRLLIEPERGRFVFDRAGHTLASTSVDYHIGMAAPIGAGAYARDVDLAAAPVVWQGGTVGAIPAQGQTLIQDSATYANPPDQLAVIATSVVAAEDERPYLTLSNHWRFQSAQDDAELLLDGLWVGATAPHSLYLQGNFERVTLRYCTLDPGGSDGLGQPLAAIPLVVKGYVEQLVIDHSIIAAIRLEGASSAIGTLTLSDSIVHASSGIAIDALPAHMTSRRSTIIGAALDALAVQVEQLDASDTLIAGVVTVADTQHGCFRFSARGPGSRVPHPYESHLIDDLPRVFASTRYGDPHYATLAPHVPASLVSGGENGSEIGAFAAQMVPVRLSSLAAKVEEYLPFGRLPDFIIEN
ncbi:hypothetical protein SAMN02745857_00767 [Andreprevotia lacus DSM 23236]|uniref:Phage tail protein (Tail_P2_I) n=1 Tax=Andreprevotia lacus DSM 23236 TaxID=1121001 RepID=A0A1W1X6W0_9NEIS|nr:hypothetical protein [Andreprevotia lacus]SMC19682.1 hypothetical protein SAMN02745857_00767 [Andreprevotia lacus DSM 23236]